MNSRLDLMIVRLTTQRACLDWAAAETAALPGPVFEIGLGSGRSYDHLRRRLPQHDIYAFDRSVEAHPACIPPADRLLLGDFVATVPEAAARFAAQAPLVHADIGSSDLAASRRLAAVLVPYWAQMLRRGGLLLSDQPIDSAVFSALPLPVGATGRYFILRRA